MLITAPHIWLKPPGRIHFLEVWLLSYWQDLSSCAAADYITGASCHWHIFFPVIHSVWYVFVCVYVCGKAKARLAKLSWFSIMHPREMWNLTNKVCKSHLWPPFTLRFRVWIYMGPETHFSWNVWNHCWMNFKLFLLEFVLTFMLKG